MQSFLMLALVFVFGACGACQKLATQKTKILFSRVAASAVHVECGYDSDGDGEDDAGGFGSGVVIAPGKVLTAGHVAAACMLARGANPNAPLGIQVRGKKWESNATSVVISVSADMAVISAPTPKAILPVVFSQQELDIGDGVELFGGIPFFERQVVNGHVACEKDEENFVVTSAHCQPGWSGGPVFDSDGLAVGIVLATLIEGGGPCLYLSIKNVVESMGNTVVFDSPPEEETCECK
jgi:S1-C subfamily serine protease